MRSRRRAMIWKRQLAIFGIAFVLVLGGGMALAAVGSWAPSSDDLGASEEQYEEPEETTTTTMGKERDHQEDGSGEGEGDHGEEPKEEPKDEPKEEPQEEPKEEPEEEPKEEPKEGVDSTPPDFGITSPENGAHVDNKVVTFKGFVEPGSTVTRGPFKANVDGEHWRIALVLSPGKNIVGFVATDAAGNKSDAAVTLYYDPPGDEPGEKEEGKEDGGDDEPEFVEFSAKQKYGSCSENPPYDVFYGTATPGTKIWIESKYGGKSTTANGDGHWEAKVTFSEAPSMKTFEVVIESSRGDRKVFTFTNTGGGEEGGGEEGGGEEGGGEEGGGEEGGGEEGGGEEGGGEH
jgi:hypothetical protein